MDVLRLLAIGIILIWIAHRLARIFELRRQRATLRRDGPSRGERSFSWSRTIVVTVSLMIGIIAILSLVYAITARSGK